MEDWIRLNRELDSLLEKINDIAQVRDVRASEFPEWNEEMKQFIWNKTSHWKSSIASNGKYSFGKAFFAMFSIYFYDFDYPPFHCYVTKGGDVLFTKKKHKWNGSCYDFEENNSTTKVEEESLGQSCLVTLILLVQTLFYAACLIVVVKIFWWMIKSWN